MGSRPTSVMAAAVAVLLAAVGCGAPPATTTTSITVFASPSLITSFSEIGRRFRAEHPGTSVQFIFARSSDLAEQLLAGTRADVFASADGNTATVADAHQFAWGPVNFASNTLVIAVAPGNPKKIDSLADLDRPGINVALCAPPGTCAADTQRIEDDTGIRLAPVTRLGSVNGVLKTVGSGQADAGLVYLTDAVAARNRVSSVRFPQAAGAVDTYAIGLLTGSEQPELARQFIDLVTEGPGQQILGQAGFGAATPAAGTRN